MGMDSSIAQHHHQEMNCSSSSQTLESMLAGGSKSAAQQQENKKPRPADMDSLKCPRCDSTNTKFCYYNNYSLSQPRYFCKSCRRYWTKGGTLRNVPVGGGCRKNKRPSSASSSCSSASSRQRSQDNNHHHPIVVGPTASIPSCNDDLNLAIARLQRQDNNSHDFSIWGNPNMPYHHMHDHSLIRSEFLETPLNGIPSFQYENIGIGMGMGMGNPYDEFNTTSMAVKDEGENSKVLFGFPWQNGGGNSNTNTGEFDSGARLSWNGINNGSSYNNWHGLLNSPLM